MSKQPCTVCGEAVEAAVPLWLNYDQETGWSVYGIGDEAAKITCEDGHDQSTIELATSLTTFIERRFPGTSWNDTDPGTYSGPSGPMGPSGRRLRVIREEA